jgi:secondary thiamine-phosphate synthase enzyme
LLQPKFRMAGLRLVQCSMNGGAIPHCGIARANLMRETDGMFRQAQHSLTVETVGKGLREISTAVAEWVAGTGIHTGLLTLFCRHTSASLLIQENADPDVVSDLAAFFEGIAPEAGPYVHRTEGPDDMPAHIRTALTAISLSVPVRDGRLALGTWQGIYLFEHRRGRRRREVVLHLIGE